MQSTAQRVLSARDPGTARRSCFVAAAMLVPLAACVAASGMAARIHPELEAPAGHKIAHHLHLGHVAASVRPVDVDVLGVVPRVMHVSVRIEAGDYLEVQLLQPIFHIPLQKGQSRLDAGRFVSVGASHDEGGRQFFVSAQPDAVDRIVFDLTEHAGKDMLSL